MILHFITGILCLFCFGRMLYLFKMLQDEGNRKGLIRELLILLAFTAFMPFALSLFATE